MGCKLLVVEDEPEISEAIAIYAKQNDYQVSCAFSGDDALAAARRERPEVILLDINLPGRDGRDVMAELAKEGLVKEAVVIFVTGRDEQSDRLLGLELGAADYETKPIHLGRLFRKIDRLLAKRRGAAGQAG